jgi:hypothetical protein
MAVSTRVTPIPSGIVVILAIPTLMTLWVAWSRLIAWLGTWLAGSSGLWGLVTRATVNPIMMWVGILLHLLLERPVCVLLGCHSMGNQIGAELCPTLVNANSVTNDFSGADCREL